MNKRCAVSILLVLVLGLSLSACAHSAEIVSSDVGVSATEMVGIYQEGENFRILSNKDHTMFEYFIYDNSDSMIDMGYHNWRGSFDVVQQENLVILNYGMGGNTWYERYYNTVDGRVSRFFERPVAAGGGLVAFYSRKNDAIILVVRSMFDPADYYREITRDFSDWVWKVNVRGNFLENGTKLQFTYWTGPDNTEVTETIDLR